MRTRKWGVPLPTGTVPAWPDKCVVCGQGNPGAHTRVIGRNNLKGRRVWAGWASATVPCCPVCRGRLQGGRALRLMMTFLVAAVSGCIGIWVASLLGWKNAAMGLTFLGFLCVGFFCQVMWEQLHPPEFDIEIGDYQITYWFRDERLAREFAAVNGFEIQDE